MLVASYCGRDAESSGIPYWVARVKDGPSSVGKYKVMGKGFRSGDATFKRGQHALDVEHYDYKGGDRSGRQKHKRMGTMQTVRPSGKSSCLLPVLFNAIETSTNFIYLSDRVHEELLDACSWVAPGN